MGERVIYEAVDRLNPSKDNRTHRLYTFEGWEGDNAWGIGMILKTLDISIVSSKSSGGKTIGEANGAISSKGEASAVEQPALKTRTNESESEEPPEDVWDITIDPTKVDIPQRNGRVQSGEAQVEGTVDLTGVEVPIELISVVEMAAVGVWEGVGVGTFEGTAV
jgi:hypothetical protein